MLNIIPNKRDVVVKNTKRVGQKQEKFRLNTFFLPASFQFKYLRNNKRSFVIQRQKLVNQLTNTGKRSLDRISVDRNCVLSLDRNCGNQLIEFHLIESVDRKF
jgi:hypothetical protein